jgi:hypothetical protein
MPIRLLTSFHVQTLCQRTRAPGLLIFHYAYQPMLTRRLAHEKLLGHGTKGKRCAALRTVVPSAVWRRAGTPPTSWHYRGCQRPICGGVANGTAPLCSRSPAWPTRAPHLLRRGGRLAHPARSWWSVAVMPSAVTPAPEYRQEMRPRGQGWDESTGTGEPPQGSGPCNGSALAPLGPPDGITPDTLSRPFRELQHWFLAHRFRPAAGASGLRP